MKILSSIKVNFSKRRIFTGIQPTGNLHIGNYLGSIMNLLQLQKNSEHESVYLSIVDYHSLTTSLKYDHSQINFNTQIGNHSFNMAKILICSGIQSNEKTALFLQSKIREHAELCWILGCLTPHHWLSSMIQYKQKSQQNHSLGIYSYPILMSADILLYKATHVPVGQDQKQHLELCKKITERFNNLVRKDFFPIPQYSVAKNSRVMSLTDPSKKMSKSDLNERSRINLQDSSQTVKEKIRRAVTDSNGSTISYDPEKRQGLANLLNIYSSFSNKNLDSVLEEMKNENIKYLKQRLFECLSGKLQQIQYKMNKISEEEVKRVLEKGEEKAREEAEKTMKEVKSAIKLYQ